MEYLELEKVRIEYPEFIISDISFSLEKGKMLVLLGPSGSGKTTLIQAICGVIPIQQGDIRVNNQSIINIPIHKRKIGIVFQDFALFPHLNVYDNIAFSLKIKKINQKEIKKRVTALLDLIELNGYEKRKVHQISGGEKQRVALARTLASDPDIILFDEPMSALDENLRERLRETIKLIQQKMNLTAIYVTHDQEEAFYLADMIGIMKEGKLIAYDYPETIYLSPPNLQVAEFIGIENIFPAQVIKLCHSEVELKINDFKIKVKNKINVRIDEFVHVLIKAESCLISFEQKSENSYPARIINYQLRAGILEMIVEMNGLQLKVNTYRSYNQINLHQSQIYITIPSESISLIKQ